jgi:hypothetical protein
MNFALILFVLLVLPGRYYAVDVLKFRKLRAWDAKDPWWVEWGASFFPVILIVFVLRSFLVRAIQDSLRLNDSDAAGGRLHPRQQIYLWHTPAGDQQEDHQHRSAAAR